MAHFLTREQFDSWFKATGGKPLVDGSLPAIRKFGSFEIEHKDVDPVTGLMDIDFVISTPALDRDNDVIDQSGWDLDHYQRNPVVLWAHDYSKPPIGKSVKVWVKGKKLLSRDRFTPQEINPFGHMVYQMIKGGFLNATSVGFRPRKYVYNDEHGGYDFAEQELMEHSVVPVPSNPEALMAASAQGIDLAPMKEWAEKILDRDPDGDKIALWLPKSLVTEIHSELSNVAVSLSSTSTWTGEDGSTFTSSDAIFDKDGDTIVDPITVSNTIPTNDNEERLMEEAMKALTEVIRELNDNVAKLPETIAAKVGAEIEAKLVVPEKEKEPDDSDEELDLSADDLKALITGAVNEAITATTGALPG